MTENAPDVDHAVRDAEKRKLDNDPAPHGAPGDLAEDPGIGGYADRDPQTEMPRMPSIPETQTDPATHDAAPDTSKPRPPHK
jgi:hypothetical protein